MTRIGILIFDGAEELDFVGPWEVLRIWQAEFPGDSVAVSLVAHHEGAVTCANGMRVLADGIVSDDDAFDVVLVPGGRGTRPLLGDAEIRNWLDRHRAAGALMTSVCTGSLLLADAGLLDGRAATTHWASLDLLASLGTEIETRPTDRYVDTGDVITASGVSAGIDMALHLVRRLASEETARQVRRAIQYDPSPPI